MFEKIIEMKVEWKLKIVKNYMDLKLKCEKLMKDKGKNYICTKIINFCTEYI